MAFVWNYCICWMHCHQHPAVSIVLWNVPNWASHWLLAEFPINQELPVPVCHTGLLGFWQWRTCSFLGKALTFRAHFLRTMCLDVKFVDLFIELMWVEFSAWRLVFTTKQTNVQIPWIEHVASGVGVCLCLTTFEQSSSCHIKVQHT